MHNIPTGKTLLLRAAGKTPLNSGEQLDVNTDVTITDADETQLRTTSRKVRFLTNENARENLYTPVSLLGSVSRVASQT